jgi:acyl carrier protein
VERAEIRSVLARIAREELGHQGALPDGDIAEWLDSVQRLALVVAIEDAFGLSFRPEEDAEVRSVEDLVALVERRLAS